MTRSPCSIILKSTIASPAARRNFFASFLSLYVDTGYRGRLGIYEFLHVSSAMREYILHGRSYPEIKELA